MDSDEKPSANFFETLVAIVPDIIFDIDDEGHFRFVNAAVKTLGYTPAELTGIHFSEIVHPDDYERVARAIVLPRLKGKVTGDKEAPKLFDERRAVGRHTMNLIVKLLAKPLSEKTGSPSPREIVHAEIFSSGIYLPDGDKGMKFSGTVGVIRNITQRIKEAELTARQKKRFAGVLRVIPDQVFRVNSDGDFLDYKPADAVPGSEKSKEPLEKNVMDTLPETVADDHIKFIKLTLSTGRTQTLEYSLMKKDKLIDYE